MNPLAVVAAALSRFLVGGLWHSPALLGAAWNRESGRDPKGEAGGHPAKVFGVSFLFSLVAAYLFAWLLGPNPPFHIALHHGLLVGAGLVAAIFGINYQLANRSLKLWLIDGGYHTVLFVLLGLVLGLWH